MAHFEKAYFSQTIMLDQIKLSYITKDERMQFSKFVVLLTVVSQTLTVHAATSDIMLKVSKDHCLGQPQNANESICKDLCTNTEFKSDIVCKTGNAEAEAAAAQKAKFIAIAKAEDAAKQAAATAAAEAAVKAAKIEKKKQEKNEKEVVKVTTFEEPGFGTIPVVEKVVVTTSDNYAGPFSPLTAEGRKMLFNSYCDWKGDISVIPAANYSNAHVIRAAEILSQVDDEDFYFYSAIKNFYKAQAAAGPQTLTNAQGESFTVKSNARLFLTQLCGEFRDRPEMIQAKVQWVKNMVRPGMEKQQLVNYQQLLKENKSIWSVLAGDSYKKYLEFSNALFSARAQEAKRDTAAHRSIKELLGEDAEGVVKPNTICETKYIIGEYVAKGRSFSDLDSYQDGYLGKTGHTKNAFVNDDTKCSQADRDYVYNFRGDANFKHYSPESNGMIWHALSIARFCSSPTKATGKDEDIEDEDCADYFSKPFLSRYNAARSGLAAWLIYAKSYQADFQNQSTPAIMLPKFNKKIGQYAFNMQVASGAVVDTDIKLKDSTLQFNEMFGIGGIIAGKKDLKGAYNRLRDAVNRHTNWYKSAYRNDLGTPKMKLEIVEPATAEKPDEKDKAYSPFVASSYEMSKSDAFAGCGYTVPCSADVQPHKAWMFVFKVHKNNWYSTNSLARREPVDFDKYWLDETSFGTDRLADAERAFDRLGTAVDDEFADIIYLKNLSPGSSMGGGGEPISDVKIK